MQRLLTLLAGMASAGNSINAAKFRSDLSECARSLLTPVPGESVDVAARKCLGLCQDFFEDADSYRLNNTAAYTEIIDTLRDALRTLSTEVNIEGTILKSTARFREIAETGDLEDLRKRINVEARQLEHAVHEHQARRNQTMKGLSDRVQALELRLNRTRERLSVTLAENSLDPLTRVANRRYFDLQLASWMEPHARVHPFVLAMFDIDDFKKINDAYGHQVGDRVLRAIARTLRLVTREEDVLARYGGEEFVLLIRNFMANSAKERCNGILKAVEAQSFEWSDAKRVIRVRSTISCGITEFAEGDTVYDLLHRADNALYRAKRSGKNRIEISLKQAAVEAEAPLQPS